MGEIEEAPLKDFERLTEKQTCTIEDAYQKAILSDFGRGSSRRFGQPSILVT